MRSMNKRLAIVLTGLAVLLSLAVMPVHAQEGTGGTETFDDSNLDGWEF